MKKCPTCSKTFEDSMRFCQVDGTPLVDEAPAFDPYATIVAQPIPPMAPAEPPPAIEPEPVAPVVAEVPVFEDPAPDPNVHMTIGSLPISEPQDLLDLPSTDPLKTMYVSDAEMQAALGGQDSETGIVELQPIEDVPAPPSFIAPELAEHESAAAEPPPSPFAVSDNAADLPDSGPADDQFDEAATMIQSSFPVLPESTPEPEPEPVPAWTPPPTPQTDWAPPPTPHTAWTPPPAPVAEWTPPPVPDAQWQNQEIGSNTPFQPPPSGAAGTNNTLGLVSLIVGLVSFVCLYGIGGLVAIILGFMQRSKIKNNPAEYGGGGLAMAGIILGAINIVAFIGFLILYAGLIFASMR